MLSEYIDIDRTIVFEILQHGLSDIEQLQRVFTGFL
jgi:uncharacterized protein YutE (UPF0331/DUF86 family)